MSATRWGSSLNDRTPMTGFAGIVVDVEHWRKRDVDAERAALQCGDPPLLICERGIARRAERHLRRKHRRAAEIDVVRQEVATALAHAGTCLVISAEHERQRAESLHRVDLFGGLDRRANRHDEAADVLLADQLADASPTGARCRRVVTKQLRPYELCRAIARREGRHYRVHPTRAARNGSGRCGTTRHRRARHHAGCANDGRDAPRCSCDNHH